jgi:hypothetical protein
MEINKQHETLKGTLSLTSVNSNVHCLSVGGEGPSRPRPAK